MNIHILFIPKEQQRYATQGDWLFDENGDLIIRVSNNDQELPTDNHRFLVARHEMDEAWLCYKRGITQKQVDDFDIPFERDFDGIHYEGELGDHPNSPYAREHRYAMISEHAMAHELGMTDYGVIK